MDVKDLTQEQLNQIASKLVDNPMLIDRAKAHALNKMIGWAESDGDQKTKAYLQDYDAADLQIVGDEPEVTVESMASSEATEIKAQLAGTFELKRRGSEPITAFGFGWIQHEEIMELGDDLFYFEDQESHSEE